MVAEIKNEWPLVNSEELQKQLGITRTQRYELTQKLPAPLYHSRFPGARKIYWNVRLIRSYLLCGGSESHLRLCEEYTRYAGL